MKTQVIRIATRESPLALQQAESIKKLLMQHHPFLVVELIGMTTEADRRLDISLIDIGGKGWFVKELEEALFDGRADIAVHSMKDVPMQLPPGLILPVMGEREDPRDAFVSNQYESLAQLPIGARVGTSSLRRQTQVRALRPDLNLLPLRGNIQTRLAKLDKGEFDAIILACAGLKRMNLTHRIRSFLSVDGSLPAAGQGALGIECREKDEQIQTWIQPLNDRVTSDCVTAERALCRRLGGGCKVPVAAYAEIHGEALVLKGLVANRDGSRILRAHAQGHPDEADHIGKRVAEDLLQQGAEMILREFL